MAPSGYEQGITYSDSDGHEKRCLKCWLVFFVLATLALIGVVLWLALAPRYAPTEDATNSTTCKYKVYLIVINDILLSLKIQLIYIIGYYRFNRSLKFHLFFALVSLSLATLTDDSRMRNHNPH